MPRILIVEADGGSRGNPGHAGYGALVRDPETGAILAEKARYLGKASNNVAEYSGLIAGLELAHEIDPECWILAKMDSKLVVEQMSGRWKIKHEDMRALAQRARNTVDPQRVKYEWIPRELNKDADRLSNEAMDAGMAGVDWQPAAERAQPAAEQARIAAEPVEPTRPVGRMHHLELWVDDDASAESLGWLLQQVGYQRSDSHEPGARWDGADNYLLITHDPARAPQAPQTVRAGELCRLAFPIGSRAEADLLARRATSHGWTLRERRVRSAEELPGYTVCLGNGSGIEVELVAAG